MIYKGGKQNIDELGRCTLHPTMQLQHQTATGEWRELLSECPLCVSGLPATALGRPSRTPERQQAQGDMNYMMSPHQKEEGNAEEIERFVISRRDALGRNKNNLQTSRIYEKADVLSKQTEWGDEDEVQPIARSTREIQPRSISRNKRGEADATSKHSKGKTRHKGFSSSAPELNCTSLSQPPHPQTEHLLSNIQGVTKASTNAADRTIKEEHNELEPLNDNDDPNLHEVTKKRPDPTDIEELELIHHKTSSFQPPPLPPPPSISRSTIPPPPWNSGPHSIQNPNQHSEFRLQSGFTTDKLTSKVLEQDEVSVMTMSSVTQQMHTKLNIQKQRHRQERQRKQLEEVDSDDESSASSTDSDDDNGRAPSTKSTALTSKVSDMCETKSASSMSSTDPGGKINTCDYDERGWCRRHPTTVQLRKKNIFRSTWQVLLSHCPECCLDEMKRVRDVHEKQSRKKGSRTRTNISSGRSESGETSGSQASSRGGRSSGGGKKSSRRDNEKKRSNKTNKNPPISQLNLRSTKSSGGSVVDQYDDTRSVGTASTVTNSSHTQSTGGRLQSSTSLSPGSPNGSVTDVRGDYASNMIAEHSGDDDGGSTAHVTRMPYIDKYGSHGWYTGQVDASTGTPHGVGTMNYSNGAVCYSEWNYGMNANPPTEIQEEQFLQGGGVGYNYPRHPRYHYSSYRSPMGHGGRSYLATLTEDGTSSDHEYADGPPSQQHQLQEQQQSTVVCGMMWTDLCGNTGAYTGEVNFLRIPQGIGSMRYDQGDVSEGIWRNGEIVSNDGNGERYRSSSSSPSSSSSSSSSSVEGQRRVGAGSYFRGSVDVGH